MYRQLNANIWYRAFTWLQIVLQEICLFVKKIFSHFDVKDRILVLIVPVLGHCLSFTCLFSSPEPKAQR